MELQSYHFALVVAVLVAAVRLHRYSKLSARPSGYPPGPKTTAFLGNLLQIPISRPELAFTDFARQFGAITGLKLGCQNLIVLNTWQAVHDLIEQKGSIYSSRPSIPVANIVVPNGENPGLSPYGDLWRAQRKKLVEFLGGERTENLKPVQDAESTQMIYDMMHSPKDFEHHVERSFGAAILATVYGQRGKTMYTGGKLEGFFKVEAQWAAALGATASPPLNSFPFLESVPDWLTPWRGWKQRALVVKREQQRVYRGLLDDARARMAQGKGTECFLASCLRTQEKDGFSDAHLSHLAGSLLEGGAETSASSTMVFIMTMAAYPDVQAEAREEVDRLCGRSRMPDKDDIAKLPFIRACVLEILRWRPVLPLGVPHQTTAADINGELSIPSDTTVMINTWKINHDESLYDAPDVYDPSRYMRSEYGCGLGVEAAKGRRVNYTFGAGRRVCPGQRFAENSMIMHFAKLVWAFDIKRTGYLPTDSWDGWTDGLVTRPGDLDVSLQLRDEERKQVIVDAWVQADTFLQQFE
jgi:cytochrome P450